MRIFSFLFCTIVGGLLGIYWSIRKQADAQAWYKFGAGTLLVMFTLITWAGNGKYDSSGNYNSPYENYDSGGSSPSSSGSNHTCPHCNGEGERINQLTGEYKDCSSCSGDGVVTQEQYDRLSH